MESPLSLGPKTPTRDPEIGTSTVPTGLSSPSQADTVTAPRPSSTSGSSIHIRSCTSCRHRKIKCDRQKPCSNCSRLGSECLYPPGPGRAPKRTRRALDEHLVDRLSSLESTIRQLQSQAASATGNPRTTGTITSPEQPPAESVPDRTSPSLTRSAITRDEATTPSDSLLENQFGRLVVSDKRSYYVRNVIWETLGNEIEELREMLSDAVPDEDESVSEHSATVGSSAAILGFRSLSHSLLSCHPTLPQAVSLLQIFADRVLPIYHVLHLPTTTRMFWDTVASLDAPDRDSEALLFAIYYSAVISLEPTECIATLNITRDAAIEQYRFAVEQALARANLLNTQSLVLVQAALIFIVALRNEDRTRTAWSLTALLFHIAQAMGLHRDGTTFGLSPLETELRRRTWYHICIIGNRISEYSGHERIVHDSVFDTRPPLHINDADITAEMTEPPPERNEACEMTFCCMLCQTFRLSWSIHHGPPSISGPGRLSSGLSLEERQAIIDDATAHMEAGYLRFCNTEDPLQLVCSTVARLILSRMWLLLYFPVVRHQVGGGAGQGRGNLGDGNPGEIDQVIRDRLFQRCIGVLELGSLLLTRKDVAKWRWYFHTNIQWHAAAFTLAEICRRPPGPECDRAWEHLCTVYDAWKVIMESDQEKKPGTLWPIRRLMAKARYVREMQRMHAGANSVSILASESVRPTVLEAANASVTFMPLQSQTGSVARGEEIPTADRDASNMEYGGDALVSGMSNGYLQGGLAMGGLDSLVEMFPDDWQADFLDVMQADDTAFSHSGLSGWLGG